MSNRYVNKSIRKDIFSNSAGRASVRFIDNSNLNLLNIDPNNGSIETKSQYSGDLNGFLLSIPSFTMTENVFCLNSNISSVFFLWSNPSETIYYDNGTTASFTNVKYVTSASRPSIGNNNFILWNTTPEGPFSLVMPTNQLGQYAILSVEESTSGTVNTVSVNAFYKTTSITTLAPGVYVIENFQNSFDSFFNSNTNNFTTYAPDSEEIHGPLQETIAPYIGNTTFYIDLDTNELTQFSDTKLYIDFRAIMTVDESVPNGPRPPPDNFNKYQLYEVDVLNGTTLKAGTKYLDIIFLKKGTTRLQGRSAPKLIYDIDGWINFDESKDNSGNGGLLKLVKLSTYDRYFYVPI